MVVRLVEARFNESSKLCLEEVYINPEHVVVVEPERLLEDLSEASRPEGLDPRQQFSKVFLSLGTSKIIVGSPTLIEAKLKSRQLLKG